MSEPVDWGAVEITLWEYIEEDPEFIHSMNIREFGNFFFVEVMNEWKQGHSLEPAGGEIMLSVDKLYDLYCMLRDYLEIEVLCPSCHKMVYEPANSYTFGVKNNISSSKHSH